MKIQTIAINKLNPAPHNPRVDLQPGDTEYEKLKRSINEFGLVEPIVWNERTGNVVGGHQRLKVLKDLGEAEIECVIVDMDEDNEKALNLALNKISGDWDNELLTELLSGLEMSEIDIELTGFTDDEIEQILRPTSPKIIKSKEIDIEDYNDDEFECECPKCGLRFNK